PAGWPSATATAAGCGRPAAGTVDLRIPKAAERLPAPFEIAHRDYSGVPGDRDTWNSRAMHRWLGSNHKCALFLRRAGIHVAAAVEVIAGIKHASGHDNRF